MLKFQAAVVFGCVSVLTLSAQAQQIRGQDEINRVINEHIRTCQITDGAIAGGITQTRPNFRGLPVTDYFIAEGGDGAVWGWVFQANIKAVSDAIPEARKPARFKVKGFKGRVSQGIRVHDNGNPGEVLLFCEWKNASPSD
jgi:hypothetical protein